MKKSKLRNIIRESIKEQASPGHLVQKIQRCPHTENGTVLDPNNPNHLTPCETWWEYDKIWVHAAGTGISTSALSFAGHVSPAAVACTEVPTFAE